MKNFRISDGDITINSGGRAEMVFQQDKLVQDLSLWLLEPLGTGFTTPNFGSLLNTKKRDEFGRSGGRFIGTQITETTIAEIESEIDRVLSIYQQNQIERIKAAQLNGKLYLFSKKEILNTVNSIVAHRVGEFPGENASQGDTIIVSVDITTGNNVPIEFDAEILDDQIIIEPTFNSDEG